MIVSLVVWVGILMHRPRPRIATANMLTIKSLTEADFPRADDIIRQAFAAQMQIPDPARFMPGATFKSRMSLQPQSNYAAYDGDDLIALICSSIWGSVGYFGPLTVLPDYWGRGIAQQLLEPIMADYSKYGTTAQGLFTFANSPKHIGLYQKFGFYPRRLTALARKELANVGVAAEFTGRSLSQMKDNDRAQALNMIRELCDGLYPGLDLRPEIEAIAKEGCGETFVWPDAFAMCHFGPGAEAETNACYVKFAAVSPRLNQTATTDVLSKMLAEIETIMRARGIKVIGTGVNTAQEAAYGCVLGAGYKPFSFGIIMHRPNDTVLDREDLAVLYDWR